VLGALAPESRVRKLFDDQRVVLLEGRRQLRKLMQGGARLALRQPALADRRRARAPRPGATRGRCGADASRSGGARPGSDLISLVSGQFAAAVRHTPLPRILVAMAWRPRSEVAALIQATVQRQR